MDKQQTMNMILTLLQYLESEEIKEVLDSDQELVTTKGTLARLVILISNQGK